MSSIVPKFGVSFPAIRPPWLQPLPRQTTFLNYPYRSWAAPRGTSHGQFSCAQSPLKRDLITLRSFPHHPTVPQHSLSLQALPQSDPAAKPRKCDNPRDALGDSSTLKPSFIARLSRLGRKTLMIFQEFGIGYNTPQTTQYAN